MHFIEYRGPSRHLDGLLDHLTEVQVANCFKIAAASIGVQILNDRSNPPTRLDDLQDVFPNDLRPCFVDQIF